MSHLVLYAALWGVAASYVAEFVKQDGFPKPVNTLIANAVVVVSAAFATLVNSPSQQFTWHLFAQALLAAFTAAVINHQFFLVPTGIGARLQSRTSAIKHRLVAPPAKAATRRAR